MPFKIIRDDIVNIKSDAIVNTVSVEPVIGSGVDAAINMAAGEELIKERKKIGIIKRGDAVSTPAFNLNAKYVIHTAGPVWDGGEKDAENTLALCYKNCLEEAVRLKCRNIAFPLISSGNFMFPKDKALRIAVNTISDFLMKNDMDVKLVVFDDGAFKISEKLFFDVESFIDENYVAQKRKYQNTSPIITSERLREPYRVLYDEDVVLGCLYSGSEDSTKFNKTIKPQGLEELLNDTDATFSQTMMEYIIKKDLKESDVYKKANMDRKLFSKIRNNIDYKPKKKTALALAIALELDMDEAKEFIAKAGYTLTHSKKEDIIVEYFITNKNFNVFEINEVLFHYGFSLIGA